MRMIFALIVVVLAGCGMPKETDISKNIDKGIDTINESSIDQSWVHSKNVEDFLHLTSYKYDNKDVKKMNKHLDKLEESVVVLVKKKTKKEWKKVKKTWKKMKKVHIKKTSFS